MKAHSETHFENENMFSEKWKVINPFLEANANTGDIPTTCKSFRLYQEFL